jgi:hypothetical protein
LFAVIPPARRKKCTVKEAFTNHDWVADIQGALTLDIITEYIQLWNLVHGFQLQPEVHDSHYWRLSSSGQYSAKSGYESLFMGATLFKPCDRIWKTWTPPKSRIFL